MGKNRQIVLQLTEDGGIFRYGDAHDQAVVELDDALDRHEGGNLATTKFLAALRDIVERHPDFIDGHAHLGYALMDQGKPKLALEAAQRGLQLGEAAIPSGFSGNIEWGSFSNRPFLRAAHCVTVCHLRLGQRKDALAIMEKMLAWNPSDNQGVRLLIGAEYLRSGKTAKALSIFKKEAHHYPPYHYERALLHFMKGDHIAAATSLRHGFVANSYVAEILCGNPDPMPLAIWHGSNFAEPEVARQYVAQCADLWRKTSGAIEFLRWLHMHPAVLAERAAVFECKEGLLWERDFGRRGEYLDRETALISGIDDGISREIIVERSDRFDKPVWPWLYPLTQPRPFG